MDIEAINSRRLSYTIGVDEFSDLTAEESMSVSPGSPTPSDEGDNSVLTEKNIFGCVMHRKFDAITCLCCP